MDNIKPIRNDDDLAWAIAEVAPYFETVPQPDTPDADRFDVLSDLIEAYENRNFPIDVPEPAGFLREFMAMSGRDQAELATVLGSRSRASEILNGKRTLTLEMIAKIKKAWGVPADCLIAPYDKAVA